MIKDSRRLRERTPYSWIRLSHLPFLFLPFRPSSFIRDCCSRQQGVTPSKFRSAIDGDAGSHYPAGCVRREESDDVRDIFRLANSFQCLHPERGLPTCLSLCEVRHVS